MSARYRGYRPSLGGNSPFYGEGWPLYWELTMYDIGFHDTPEKKIGALFWRMHRCARIIFSLKFHMGEWSPQECVDFLVDRVGFERENAIGEVRRSFQGGYGPLYQAAYLLGGIQLRALRKELVDTGVMSQKAFHDEILRQGSMPITLLRLARRPAEADARHGDRLEVLWGEDRRQKIEDRRQKTEARKKIERMTMLPTSERLLLGPGPSMMSPRVMRALAAPVLGHLDPDLLAMMDEVRGQLRALFRAPDGGVRLRGVGHRHVGPRGRRGQPGAGRHARAGRGRPATSATGSRRCASATAGASRGSTSSGAARAIRSASATRWRASAPTSSASSTPRPRPASATRSGRSRRSRTRPARSSIVDAVTSLGGHPLEMEAWGIDAAYSCTQKCVGAPSGLAPVAFAPSRARAARDVPQLLPRPRACSRTTGCAASTTTRSPPRSCTRCTRR